MLVKGHLSWNPARTLSFAGESTNLEGMSNRTRAPSEVAAFRDQAKSLVQAMTLEEKASLCSGRDFWTTKPIERLGLVVATILTAFVGAPVFLWLLALGRRGW